MHAAERESIILSTTRRGLLRAALVPALLGAMPAARAAGPRTIRIGYQRYGTLILLKHTGYLEAVLTPTGDRVVWSEFISGPPMVQAMAAGAIDFGITGDTPPIFAQAASDRVVYVGHEPPAPFGEAIVVPATSAIRDVAGLRGKTVAVNRGANAHWLLLAALAKSGMTMADIRPAFLAPGAARPAFDSGRLDAWSIWDPYLSAVEVESSARVLVRADGIVANRQFFLAERGFAARDPDLVRLVLAQIARSDAWAEAHKAQASAMLAADAGLPVPVVRLAIGRLTYGVQPITPDVVADQQRIADAFFAQHLLPDRLRVQAAVPG